MIKATRALVLFLLASVLAGVVLAAAALPFVGALGLTARSGAEYWDSLPGELEEPPLPQGSVLLASDGKTRLATLYLYNRKTVPLEKIAPIMRTAIVDIEDSRFYSNPGVDLRAMLRALKSTGTGEQVQGGSTITQQYVKQTLLLSAQTEEERAAAAGLSLERKLREAKMSIGLTQKYSKDEILAKYLNIAYFGAGAYGVEAAAQRYYSVPAAKLNLNQAATLAGLVQSPNGYDPLQFPDAAKRRRDQVLNRMAQLGHITVAQRDATIAKDLELNPSQPKNGCAASLEPFFCDWVTEALLDDPALGATEAERKQRLLEGGLTITTTLDVDVQTKAEKAVRQVVPADHRVAAVSVAIEPGTGQVKSLAVNREYGTGEGQTVLPLFSTAWTQPGSTFKAFTLAAALEAGVPLNTRLPGGDRHRSSVFDNPSSGYFRNAYDGHKKNLTLAEATAASTNTAFVQLQERIGTRAVAEAAHRAGVASLPLTGEGAVGPKEGSLTLGTREASPLEIAAAYATFAAHGKYCAPVAVTQIKDRAGTALPGVGPRCAQAFTPAVADTVTSLLATVMEEGGTGHEVALAGGRPSAGKTGTTEGHSAALFAGYTPQLAVATVVADPRGPHAHPLINTLGYDRVYGSDVPAVIWKKVMDAALAGQPVKALPSANPAYLLPSNTTLLPSVLGQSVDQARAQLEDAGLVVRTLRGPTPRSAAVAPGTVVGMEPAAGAPLVEGMEVTLTLAP